MDRLDKKNQRKSSYGATTQSGYDVAPPSSYEDLNQDPLGKEAADLGVRTYDSTTGLAIMLNYIVGSGCFGLPMAFYQGGLVFGPVLLILGCLVMFVSANYVLENMARARGVSDSQNSNNEPPHNFIGYIKHGYSDMLQLFAGDWGRIAVTVCISLYSFGTLAAYASMFASSTASLACSELFHTPCDVFGPSPAPACLTTYYVMMGVFASIVVSLALRDMGDQAFVQKLLTGYRIVAFVLMLLTVAIKLVADKDLIADRVRHIGAFNPHHFADAFGPVFLALCMHYNLPDAIQPMRNKNAAGTVTYSALALSSVVYLMLGVGGALAFDKPNALASLNWTDYTSCGDGWSPCESPLHALLGYLVRLTIVLFPVVTVTSAFPLVCVTVGDNLMTSVPSEWIARLGHRHVHRMVRLVAAIPPLLFAIVFRGITFIFAVTGLIGFVIGLVVPVALQLLSARYIKKHWPAHPEAVRTPYTTMLSGPATAIPLMVVALVATVYSIATVKLH